MHIIHSGFVRRIFSAGSGWWEYRFKIFEHYTLKSLLNQNNQNFYYLMNISKAFPMQFYDELNGILERSGLTYIIANRSNMGELKEKVTATFPKSKYIYATRVDTDDLLHKSAVDEIQSYPFDWRRALVYQKGYLYDCVENNLRHYFAKSPPFTTTMFPRDIFLDRGKLVKYLAFKGSHDRVFDAMESLVLSENKYIVLYHKRNKNERSRDTHVLRKDLLIDKSLHSSIIENFGISEDTYEKTISNA